MVDAFDDLYAILSNEGLSTSDLGFVLRNCKHTRNHYVGVFPSDEEPKIDLNSLPIGFVWNTGDSSTRGEHWVCVWLATNNTAYFFDSSGYAPQQEFVTFLKKVSTRQKAVFKEQVQDYLSSVCGQYCLYVMIMKSIGKSDKEIRKPFTKNYVKNDEFVQNWVRTHIKNCIKGFSG